MFQPLSGLRVVDLTQILAGPYSTYQLALMGAEVIKVEMPDEGDATRTGMGDPALGGDKMGLSYVTQGSNKRSITIDLKKPEIGKFILKLNNVLFNCDRNSYYRVKNDRPEQSVVLKITIIK